MAPGTSSTCCGCTIGSTTKTSSARVPQQRPGCNPKSQAIFRQPDGTKIPKRQFETHATVSIPSSAREGRIVEKGCCGSIYVSLGFTFPRRIGVWLVSAVKFRAPGCGLGQGRRFAIHTTTTETQNKIRRRNRQTGEGTVLLVVLDATRRDKSLSLAVTSTLAPARHPHICCPAKL